MTTIAAKTISARLAHVEQEQDLLAHSVVRLDRRNAYLAMVAMPDDRPTEQALLDAGKQIVRAICHLFEGVPGDHGIAIHHTEIALRSPARSDVPVEASVHLEIDRDNPRHFLWQCESTVDFWQGPVLVGQAHIKGMTLPRTVGDPMMRGHHARPSAVAA
jgi:hypothetical protein